MLHVDRAARLLSTSTRLSRILEIGPGYNPIAPRSAGWNVHVVDHAPRDELRLKYGPMAVDIDSIEDVDTVWKHGSLHAAVPCDLHGQFDSIIGSHVIEHIPDLVGFLASAERLCAPHGTICL